MIRLFLALATVSVLAGCTAGPDRPGEPRAALPQSPANHVELTARAEQLAFEPGQAALAGERLRAFQARLSPAALGRGHLVLVAPAEPEDALSERRAAWTLAALQDAGVSVLRAATPLPSPDGEGGGVVLEIQQALVAVPACETYPRALYARIDEAASGRLLGCANTANLGLMVADPVDLVRGRALAPADGIPAAQAVEKYRTAGGKSETTNPIAEAFAKAFGGKDK